MIGIRGAVCAEANTEEAIHRATRALLAEILESNALATADVRAAFFTMTPDLDADFPAHAARAMGWSEVPMLGAQETPVAGAPRRAIRVLLLAEAPGPARHVYLGEAARLRSDLAGSREAAPAAGKGRGPADAGTLLVVGLGLVGGSLAAAARRAGLYARVRGHDADPAAARRALERGLVDGVGELAVELATADLVVLAAPLPAILELLPRVAEGARPGAVVTDVGSLKAPVVEAMDRLPERLRAVGGHPLAGGVGSGPDAADPALFAGAPWALVRTARTDDGAWAAVEGLVRGIGARPLAVEAAAHDAAVAVTSGLPAAAAIALTEVAADLEGGAPETARLLGPGFVGGSRLAAADPQLTVQLLAGNAAHVGPALDRLLERLGELRRALGGDATALHRRLAAARRARERLGAATPKVAARRSIP